MKRTYAIAFGIMLALASTMECAHAAEPVIQAYVGANGAWYNDDARPSDFELGGNGVVSLSPHIDLVGAAYFGVHHTYLRGSAGVRFTATDPEDKHFSVGLGIQRHVSSEPAIRSEEWVADVTVGIVPWPATRPQFGLIGQGGYGMDTGEAHALVGARWTIR